MIGIFHNIIAGEPKYYVAEETETENGRRIFTRLSGSYDTKEGAQRRLKIILRERKKNGFYDRQGENLA